MTSPERVMIAAWGSRGDLQPVTSLALRLKEAGRDVLVFATPPATDLIQANGIDCVIAKENVAEFVENMFGQADLSDRSIGGLMKLANFAKEYLNSPDYVAMQKADLTSALAAAQSFKPAANLRGFSKFVPAACGLARPETYERLVVSLKRRRLHAPA